MISLPVEVLNAGRERGRGGQRERERGSPTFSKAEDVREQDRANFLVILSCEGSKQRGEKYFEQACQSYWVKKLGRCWDEARAFYGDLVRAWGAERRFVKCDLS